MVLVFDKDKLPLEKDGMKANWKAAKHIERLEGDVEELTKRISCNVDAHGLIKFTGLTTCKCLAAEIFQRDKLIYQLEKENGILRKEKLLRKE